MISVFAGCQIPYPKREFLTEEEPDDKGDKVSTGREAVRFIFQVIKHHPITIFTFMVIICQMISNLVN